MDMNIIIIGIISGVALLLGIINWSRNNEIKEEINILKGDVEKQLNAFKKDKKILKRPEVQKNPDKHKNEIPKPNDTDEISHNLTYFRIGEDWYGQGRIIQVNFNVGIHQDVSYVYDHDYLYDNVIDEYEVLPAWINNHCFMNSQNIPGNVIDYVREI